MLDRTEERQFPIMGYLPMKDYPSQLLFIPWHILARHENRALLNHDHQTLEQLAKRGGLSACEAVAILEDRRYRYMDRHEAVRRLRELTKAV